MQQQAQVLAPVPPAPLACHACGAEGMQPFLPVRGLPVLVNRLWPPEEARAAPRGEIAAGIDEIGSDADLRVLSRQPATGEWA